jgi:hypothetical protein
VSRFGIMFFDDPPAAFAKLIQWLTPGGRFAFAAWGPLPENAWMSTVRQVAAEIIDVPPFDANAPGPFRYGEADKLLTLLDQAGYGEITVNDWRGLLPIGGAVPVAEAVKFALASIGSFGELLAKEGDEALSAARQSLTARLAKHEQDGVVWMDACVHIFSGVRPG